MNKEKNMSNKRVVNDNNKSLCFKKFESLWSLGPKVQKTKDVGKLRRRAFVRVITNSTEISRCNVAQN